jgi:hypothetical protein
VHALVVDRCFGCSHQRTFQQVNATVLRAETPITSQTQIENWCWMKARLTNGIAGASLAGSNSERFFRVGARVAEASRVPTRKNEAAIPCWTAHSLLPAGVALPVALVIVIVSRKVETKEAQ